jgi:hypothetical protein
VSDQVFENLGVNIGDIGNNEPVSVADVPVTRQDTPDSEVQRNNADGHRETEFFNQHDGIHGRAPGEYLDRQERAIAEKYRAAVEDRGPDYNNMPATAGTPLVIEDQLRESAQSTPNRINADPEVVSTLPVDETTAEGAQAATDKTDRSYENMVRDEDATRRDALAQTAGTQPS